MADLNYIERADEVKIVGQDSTGARVNYVGADANGNLTTKDYADGTPGSAAPTVAMQIGGTDGTNLRALLMDASGRAAIRLFDSAGTGITLGQTTMASSLPVTIASNQSNLPSNITQFGGVNISTGTGASGTGIPRVTVSNDSKVLLWDATNTATIKAASTAAAAADTSLVVALSPNSPLSNFPSTVNTNYGTVGASTIRTASQVGNAAGAADFNVGAIGAQTLRVAAELANASGIADFGAGASTAQTLRVTASNFPTLADTNFGTVGASTIRIAAQIGNATGAADFNVGASGAQTLRVAANLADGSANKITSDNPGTAANQRLHVAVPDTTTASTALGALNAAVQIQMAGMQSSGFQLAAGTLIGTIIPECSVDGGTTWVQTQFYNPTNQSVVSSVVFASANTLTVLGVVGFPGISHARVRVSAYTSGTANAILRAATVTGSSPSPTVSAAFGTVSNTSVTMPGNTPTLLVSANANRKYLAIANNSGSKMQMQFTNSPALTGTTGIQIPAGGFYEFKGDNLYTGTVYGFAAGGITVSVVEGTP